MLKIFRAGSLQAKLRKEDDKPCRQVDYTVEAESLPVSDRRIWLHNAAEALQHPGVKRWIKVAGLPEREHHENMAVNLDRLQR